MSKREGEGGREREKARETRHTEESGPEGRARGGEGEREKRERGRERERERRERGGDREREREGERVQHSRVVMFRSWGRSQTSV